MVAGTGQHEPYIQVTNDTAGRNESGCLRITGRGSVANVVLQKFLEEWLKQKPAIHNDYVNALDLRNGIIPTRSTIWYNTKPVCVIAPTPLTTDHPYAFSVVDSRDNRPSTTHNPTQWGVLYTTLPNQTVDHNDMSYARVYRWKRQRVTCKFSGCTEPPTYMNNGDTCARFCKTHQVLGMVAVAVNEGGTRPFEYCEDTLSNELQNALASGAVALHCKQDEPEPLVYDFCEMIAVDLRTREHMIYKLEQE